MFIVLLAFIGIGMCMTTMTYYSASSLTFMGERFCRNIAIKHYKDSFYQLTKEFQNDVKLYDYKMYLQSSPLQTYRSADWDYRRQDEDTGLLRGYIRTENGRRVSIEMNFQYEDKRWKINQLYIDRNDVRQHLNALKHRSDHATVPAS
jgi:hypothetical protein